ncbi:hypothetical protein [Alteromonas sp. KUL17]|uniref:hypothetical protein n=1 Tax=Alteromonas sp. KUL17 TaxID=2480796 RepID=UPI00215B2F42|nr:hypothetical protein [Alteromonas sp. KUL17]
MAWNTLRQDFRIFRRDRTLTATLKSETFNVRPLNDFNAVNCRHAVGHNSFIIKMSRIRIII